MLSVDCSAGSFLNVIRNGDINNMKTAVIFSSETGFTKKYAQWIADELNCDIFEFGSDTAQKFNDYERIIYGGSIAASHIAKLNKINPLKNKSTIIFAVGLTEMGDKYKGTLIQKNKLNDTPFFYLRGGVNYNKLGFVKKSLLKKITGLKDNADFSNKEYIKPLVEFCKK